MNGAVLMTTPLSIPFRVPSKEVNRISKLFPNPKKTRALLLAVECPDLMVKERAALVAVHRTTLWRWGKDPIYMREYVYLTELKNKRMRNWRGKAKVYTQQIENDLEVYRAVLAA